MLRSLGLTDMERKKIGWKHCPYCGDDEVYRSRREPLTWVDRVCVLLLLQLVRCRRCQMRHYRPVFFPAPEYSGRIGNIRSVQNSGKDEKHERSA
jgi:hypothetical protein